MEVNKIKEVISRLRSAVALTKSSAEFAADLDFLEGYIEETENTVSKTTKLTVRKFLDFYDGSMVIIKFNTVGSVTINTKNGDFDPLNVLNVADHEVYYIQPHDYQTVTLYVALKGDE